MKKRIRNQNILYITNTCKLARLRCAALRRSVGRARLARRQVLGAAPRIVGVGGARRAGVGTRGRLVEARLAGRALRARRRHALLALAARAALLHRRVEGARRPGRRHAVACRTAHEPIDGAVPDPRRVGRHGRHHIRPAASEARGARLTGVGVGIEDVLGGQAGLALLLIGRPCRGRRPEGVAGRAGAQLVLA